MTASLVAVPESPAPVGAQIVWDASAWDQQPGHIWYRFRIRHVSGEFRTVRDFGPEGRLIWSATTSEGLYEIEVSVRNVDTGETAATTSQYEVLSRVADGVPTVNPTAHPLVWLYSAPPCLPGARMRVRFGYDDNFDETPAKSCQPDLSMNFYLAGLRADMEYTARAVLADETSETEGPDLTFRTEPVSLEIAGYSVSVPPEPGTRGVLLQSTIFQTNVATDLAGNVVWYYPLYLSTLTRPAGGGSFFGLVQLPELDASFQVLREFDVAGYALRETNAARINEQLAALGKRPITAFHHEAAPLPDGRIVTLANTEQVLNSVQGDGDVNVLSDMILVLDQDLQVVWAWDALEHLDPFRGALLGHVCTPSGGGCPPFYLTPEANDWLHGNSVQLTPDGNLLFSVRHQDWILKIDYRNGEGAGDVLWRLGSGGDFTIRSRDPEPWFSHQHDAQLLPNDLLLVFDNGNVRAESDAGAHSRGQVFRLDENTRSAKLLLNFDLGGYSFALGSAQKLSRGRFHFGVGFLPGQKAVLMDVDVRGGVVYAIEVGTPVYRSFRLSNIYSP